MLLCPLDYRYGRHQTKIIFAEENRLKRLLEVEAALARAHAGVGKIPKEAADEITAKASLEFVSLERVREIEEETKHDIMAMVRALTEQCGDAGKYVHLGATSNDIIDTATALQLSQALQIVEEDILDFIRVLAMLAKKHRDTIMVGRTHGQFAIPITFGFKIAGYLSEMIRYLERLREMRKRVLVGKMSGAVGTGAALGPNFLEIQSRVMLELELEAEEVATQIVDRDRYAELVALMSMMVTSCERFATEVRNLQRSEIQEVSEAFDSDKQVGSSTMAHKKNPVLSENICGLARIVRAMMIPALENMVLWHERDLTNSSAERFIIPHVMVLTDDIMAKSVRMFSTLLVDAERMRSNIELSRGLIMAEAVMIALVEKGMGRQEAHELVRQCSMRADSNDMDLKSALIESSEVASILSEEELNSVLEPGNYIGDAAHLVDETVSRAESVLASKP
jgi:adenylosuccinate lyase